jgi:putative nucleotidyltransferase with HDIG domain
MEQEAVLVIDKCARTRERLLEMLRSVRLMADDVTNVPAALDYLSARPDCGLVIGEVEAAPNGGAFLLDAIGHDHPEIPVIATVGVHDARLATEIFRCGAADLLLKPLNRREVLQAVGRSLEQNRMRRQTLAHQQNLEGLVAKRTAKLRATMTDLELSYDITIEAMGDALDLRDEETEGHSKRVTAYTVALARAMRISPQELKTIARGAFLHDIGKIAIPDSILLKPGKLSTDEMVVMQTHCERGYATIRKIPFLNEAAEIVYSHQEAFDGSGYPRGLRGEEIPLGARIFAIADTLAAMTSDRPYRKGMSFAEAATEIARCRATQFDPEIVDVFLAMPRATWETIRARVGRNSHASELVRAVAA